VGRLDAAAFAAFHARTSRALRAYVYRVLGPTPDVDDIVQEAYLRMLRADAPCGDDEQLRRYLFRVTGNLIVDRWRRRTHEPGGELSHEPASPRPRYEEDAAVATTFAELKPRDRALLWLAYVEGESHEEIASSLGVRPGGVKVMLFRARRRLRDLLQARGLVVN
jgi:RNA polymerase sigma-70 factor (ECF subfamily)